MSIILRPKRKNVSKYIYDHSVEIEWDVFRFIENVSTILEIFFLIKKMPILGNKFPKRN